MAKPKLTAEERERVMGEVARLTARGYRQDEIARRLDLNQPMVSYYVQKIKKTAAELGVDELMARRSRVLRELDEVRREAWEAWENSKKETRLVVTREGVEREEVDVPGDPRFLQTLRGALEDERQLLGLDATGEDDGGTGPSPWEILATLVPGRVPVDDVEGDIVAALPAPEQLKNGANGHHKNGHSKG